MRDPKEKAMAIRAPKGARVMEIDWADGHKSRYPHRVLRGYCPCAGCQGHEGPITFREPGDHQLELEDLAPVGNYAIELRWFDGHASGLFSYRYLRALCQCDACAPAELPHERARL
jgi:DUF971 family protein